MILIFKKSPEVGGNRVDSQQCSFTIISLSRYQPINIDVIVVSDDITTKNHCPRSTYSRVHSSATIFEIFKHLFKLIRINLKDLPCKTVTMGCDFFWK
jgi:hypothetical protein